MRTTFRSLILTLTVFSLVPNFSHIATAADTEIFYVTPENLRTQLLEGNIAVLDGLNQVYQAKALVNLERTKLLPSINLGLGGSASDPVSFALSNVAFLLPFLLPSKWFDVRKSVHLLEAEGDSFYILQLNQFASIYSLYATVVGDLSIYNVVKQQVANHQKIQDLLEEKDKFLGSVIATDLAKARAQTKFSLQQLSQMDVLIKQERAALRQALGLSLETDIQFIATQVPAPDLQSMDSLQKIIDLSLAIAPENRQIEALIAANKSDKWSKVFGVITGATISGQSSPPMGSEPRHGAFDKLNYNATIGIGFSYLPAIRLNQHTSRQLELRKIELRLEHSRMLESTMAALSEIEKQIQLVSEAEQEYILTYQQQLKKYSFGTTDLLHVVSAQNDITAASLARVKAQLDLDHLRISRHRILLSDQFKEIKNCDLRIKAQKTSEKGFFKWLGEIFSPNRSQKTIDQVCRAGS